MGYRRVIITRFGGPEVLQIEEVPALPEPKPGEVRVKVLAAGVAFTDVMIRKGMYPDVKERPPFTPGYDMVGIVDKLGKGTTRLRVGQRVADLTVIGSQSEYLCLPEDRLTPVPDGLDPAETVSLVLSYVTAFQMIHRVARLERGARGLIHGAGGAVGMALLQLGRLLELEMVGTDDISKHELIAGFGAIPVDFKSNVFPQSLREAAKDGFDAAFDPIGGESFKLSFRMLRHGGRLVAYGFYNAVLGRGRGIPLDLARLKLWDLLPNGRSAQFYSIGALRKKRPEWFSEDLAALLDLLSQGKIRPVIGARLPLRDVQKAHDMIEKAAVRGKIVMTFDA